MQPSLSNTEKLISEGPVLLDLIDGSIAHLQLNRPEASNGMSVVLLKALHEAIMRCHGDARIRVVVLSGAGRHFCAGGDVKDFAAKGEGLPDYLRQATTYLQICASGLMHLNAPVIAAVQGYAAGGGGLGLVCASDLAVAEKSAKFLTAATRAGMAPDAGSTVSLARIIGFRRAMDLFLTNREVSAAEAHELGLINQVAPDGMLWDVAFGLAQQIAKGAPLAMAATKRLMWSGLGMGMESAMPEESRTVAELSGTADSREALAAVIEKRKPIFQGR